MAGDKVGGVDDHPSRQEGHRGYTRGEGESYGSVSERICRVVEAMERGVSTPEEIAAVTGLSLETVRAVLGVLLAEGYVREVRGECRCPLRRVCPFARLRARSLKAYTLVKAPPWCKR